MTTPPPPDAEFTRKLALGILSILNQKGLLTSEEVDAILYTARRAAQTAEPARRGPLSDPQPPAPRVQRIRRSLSDPQPLQPYGQPQPSQLGLPPLSPRPTVAATQPTPSPDSAATPAPTLEESAPPPLPLADEAARAAEARWTRKEPLPPPTFDIEL